MEAESEPAVTRPARARRIAFRVVLVLAVLLVLAGLIAAYPLILINWLPRNLFLELRSDLAPGDEVHRLHSLALSVLAWGMLLGLVVQFRRPEARISALLASFVVPVAIALGEMFAGTYTIAGTAPFLVLTGACLVLHPGVKELLRMPRWNLLMLGLVVVSAVPWTLYAVRTGNAAGELEPGFEVGHLTFTSALALLVVFWGLVGALELRAWQYAAGASIVACSFVALQSLIFPGVLSGVSTPWAVAALVWCIGYGAAAVMRTREPGRSR